MAALPEMVDLAAVVPNWTIPEYCTCYGLMLDTRRFRKMFSDGQGKTMSDRRDMRHDTGIKDWERGWQSMYQ